MFQAMIETQNRMQNYIEGFRFNLGFSGKFFHHGSPEENMGDDALIGKWWQQNPHISVYVKWIMCPRIVINRIIMLLLFIS